MKKTKFVTTNMPLWRRVLTGRRELPDLEVRLRPFVTDEEQAELEGAFEDLGEFLGRAVTVSGSGGGGSGVRTCDSNKRSRSDSLETDQ